MWAEFFLGYGLFILKIFTILIIIIGISAVIFSLKMKNKGQVGELLITDLSKNYKVNTEKLSHFYLSEDALKQVEKLKKKEEKKEKKKEKKEKKNQINFDSDRKPHLFVLNFKGDIAASESAALREEISTILSVAKTDDEVLLRLESPGGIVHEYGLAASQLMRLKQHNIKLTVAIDKVAASGGYMMACVADRIISAPFAIVGSIGVVAQIPNIHRLLKKHDVDVDVMTAGEYKRTVTMLGENTEKGKQKFQQELEETHDLFKSFVSQNRPQLDIDKIATGEHWFGQQAVDLKLVDKISTSDDIIFEAIKEKTVLEVKFLLKKPLLKRLGKQAEESTNNILMRFLKKDERMLF